MQFIELEDSAKRQFIDARTVFIALEKMREEAAEVRGGMYWKTVSGKTYLVRTASSGAQKSLGVRSAETKAMHAKFTERKTIADKRVADLADEMARQQRRNKAEYVGRTPEIVVDILNRMTQSGIADHFVIIGTHALYAYEQAAGVRIIDSGALATRDVDLLWDTRKRIQLAALMKFQSSSMLGLLQKVDATFKTRQDQHYTAINSRGFEVDIIRREARDVDPHPLKITEHEEEFWAVQARRASNLLHAKKFTTPVVAANGTMARMTTVAPDVFAKFKRWMAKQPDREPEKRSRDLRQAKIVTEIATKYLNPG